MSATRNNNNDEDDLEIVSIASAAANNDERKDDAGGGGGATSSSAHPAADAFERAVSQVRDAPSAAAALPAFAEMSRLAKEWPTSGPPVPDKQAVIELSMRRREEWGPEQWSGVAPAFGQLLSNLTAAADNDNAGAGAGSVDPGFINVVKPVPADPEAPRPGPAGSHWDTLRAADEPAQDSAEPTSTSSAVAPAVSADAGARVDQDPDLRGIPVALFRDVRKLYANARNYEISVAGAVTGGVFIALLIVGGVMAYSDNYFGYTNSACHCVAANWYFGWFEGAAIIAMYGFILMILTHDPSAGAWGTTDEEWPAEKKERALRQSLAYAINNPEAQLMRSWGIHAVWLVTFYWVFPVSWVLVTYCLYGVAFLFFFLGTCRLDCNDERVLDSADWFATVMTDLWSDAGSMFVDNGVDDSGNPLPGTGTVFPVWPYMGDRPHVVVGRALILAVLVNAVVGMLSDMLLFIRVVGMKTRHRHAAPAVAAAAAALPAPT